MNKEDWKRRLEDLTTTEEQQAGCRIYLDFERRLSGPAGRIVYHNPTARTLTVNLHCLPTEHLSGRKGEVSAGSACFNTEYCFQYIAAMVRLDKPADGGRADSYPEGLAILCRRMKRNADHAVNLKFIRSRQKKLSLKTCWSPDELFCDVTALLKAAEKCNEAGLPAGYKRMVEEQRAEAGLLFSMPEIFYPKKKRPYLSVPYLLQKLREQEQTDILESMVAAGGPFSEGMRLRMMACGAENLSGSGFDPAGDGLWAATDAYRQQAVAWLKESKECPSRIVRDNRIGVERTVSRINELMKNDSGFGNSGTVHPLGYY